MRRLAGLIVLATASAGWADDTVRQDTGKVLDRDDAIALVQAVREPARPDGDRRADATRKPAAVLGFFGIQPGMHVLDMFASGGYYTEIVSRYVGLRGKVYAHNNAAYRDYAAKQIEARYRDGRLPNVERLDVEADALVLEPASIDAALMILAYHDLYWRPDNASWPTIDGPRMLGQIHAALKPGGVLGVVDHVGAHDLDEATIGELHRIPPSRVIAEIEAAGFVLEDSSTALANADDDHGMSAFDPAIRGRTDRFVYRFRKPVDAAAAR